jgi:TetR/AcrR family transcriptional regulator
MNFVVCEKLPKPGKRGAAAEQLLQATSRLLAERNATDVSLSEIAAASGLNSALIKYHFGSKNGLLVALVRRDATASLSRLDDLVKMNISAQQKIRLHVAGIVKTYIRCPYLNRLIHVLLSNSDEKITREITNFFVKPLVKAQAKILDEGFARGDFRRVDPMFFYYSLIGACDHMFFARYSLKAVFGIEQISSELREGYIDFICEQTLGMLRKEPDERG